jgi:iron complex outermembrane receptor protein
MEANRFAFSPASIGLVAFETSFETVTGKKQNGDYLPLIP